MDDKPPLADRLRAMDPTDLDRLVATLLPSIRVDCRDCGRCCRELHLSLTDAEADRLADLSGLAPERFRERYLSAVDEEKPWLLREKGCPFQSGNLCTVYDERPSDCRSFPHLHLPGFRHRLHAVFHARSLCPIVADLLDRLEAALDA